MHSRSAHPEMQNLDGLTEDELRALYRERGSGWVDSLPPAKRLWVIASMTPEQRRQRAAELGLDPAYPWADSVLAESKAERKARQRRNSRAILHSMARHRATRRGIMSSGRVVVARTAPRSREPRPRRASMRRRARLPGSSSGDSEDDLAARGRRA